MLDSIAKDTIKEFSVKFSGDKLLLLSKNGVIKYQRVVKGSKFSQYIKKEISKKQYDHDFTERMIQNGNGTRFIPPIYQE